MFITDLGLLRDLRRFLLPDLCKVEDCETHQNTLGQDSSCYSPESEIFEYSVVIFLNTKNS